MNRRATASTAVGVGGALLVLGFIAGTLANGPLFERFDFLYRDYTIDACLDRLGVDLAQPEVSSTRLMVRACYEKLQLQGELNEFLIRRVSFQTQHFAENVVMWMVVLMTLAGVALAGYQIVMSAKLSPGAAPAESEFSIERGRLFLRSSITGLFILIVSFAFFYVYILYVYAVWEVGDPLPSDADEPVGEFLEGGGVLLDHE